MAVQPDLLFRCCSSTSAGRLNSGKLAFHGRESPLSNQGLLNEFASHSQLWSTDPTALVSTTTNFLRVIHLAFNKLWDGEDANEIEIIMLTPDSDSDTRMHHAAQLARQVDWLPEVIHNYEHEYVFEWKIPNEMVGHRITLGTLLRRGFTLKSLCGRERFESFPDMASFWKLIQNHCAKEASLYKREEESPYECTEESLYKIGYKVGVAGCTFGVHALTGSIVDEVLGLIFYCPENGPFGFVKDGIEDALETFILSIGDGLQFYEAELADLSEAAAILDHEFVTRLEEIGWDCCGEVDTEANKAYHPLAACEEEYHRHRERMERSLEDIYLQIGY